MVELSQLHVTTGKTISSVHFSSVQSLSHVQLFVGRVISLLFHTESRFVIALLPRSNHLLILSAVILDPKRRKSVTTSTFSPSICHEVMRLDAIILTFIVYLVLSQLFHSPPSPSSRGSLVPLCFLPLE